MRVKGSKGFPTVFYISKMELEIQGPLFENILKEFALYFKTPDYDMYILKEFSQKKLYPKNIVLKGGFTLPDTFYGDGFDLCKTYNLYLTFGGLSNNILPTGRYLFGDGQNLKEPVFIGDNYNNQIVKEIDYHFDSLNSEGAGYVGI